jgi:hypothetical protein
MSSLFLGANDGLSTRGHRAVSVMRLLLLVTASCPHVAIAAATQDPAGQPAATSPANTNGPDLIDKILIMVGPSDPKGLTEKERFQAYLLSTGGPVPLIGEAAGAGVGQWLNSPKEWGQGWGAYGERFGSNLAYNAVRQTITYGTSIVFREDDRYFASTAHGFWPRTRHALVSTFTARHPNGRQMVSVSSVTGVIGASAISSIWGPDSWKGPGNIAANSGISFASTAGFNVVREFLADILHRPRK